MLAGDGSAAEMSMTPTMTAATSAVAPATAHTGRGTDMMPAAHVFRPCRRIGCSIHR